MRLVLVLLALALAAVAKNHPRVPKDVLDEITGATTRAHLRFLSDPLLEGRLSGSRGETLAAMYIASALESAGIAPAGDAGTFFQKVPLRSVAPTTPGAMTFSNGASSVVVPAFTGYVGSTQGSAPTVSFTDAEVVYVGFGIVDAALGWNDYKTVDVTGKVVMALLGQPQTGTWAGKPLHWQGRWNGKVEEAVRHGAKALLMVNNATYSSYTYVGLQGQQGGTVVQSPTALPATPLDLYTWIEITQANSIAQLSGAASIGALYVAAEAASFTPYTITPRLSLTSTFTFTSLFGTNVVGKIVGSNNPNDVVVGSAHIDHLGVRASDGAVYTGALDNAGSAAMLLNMATALGRRMSCGALSSLDRSLYFLFPTAEEFGLYGAYYWIKQAQLAGLNVIANVNYDIANAWGETVDIVVVGYTYSTFGSEILPWAAELENTTAIPDPQPSAGLLYRGDQWAFMQNNIPSVWLIMGLTLRGGAPMSAYAKFGYYSVVTYHQPTDVYKESFIMDGMVQDTRIGLRALYAVAHSHYIPTLH